MQDVLVIIVLGLLAFYFFWWPQLNRSNNLKRVANDLNIPFYRKGNGSLYEHLEYFYLFSLSSKSKITNMLHQEDKETELAFYDFTFVIGEEVSSGGGANQFYSGGTVSGATEYKQSVVYFCSPKLDLPQFVLQPKKNFINLAIFKILIFLVTQNFLMIIYFKGIQRNRYVIYLIINY